MAKKSFKSFEQDEVEIEFNEPIKLRDIEQLLTTTTTIPTKTPKKFIEQFQIYLDSISSPTVKRLYLYSNKSNSWFYISLT